MKRSKPFDAGVDEVRGFLATGRLGIAPRADRKQVFARFGLDGFVRALAYFEVGAGRPRLSLAESGP